MTARFVGVIDIDKSNAQVAIVDLETRSEVDVRKRSATTLSDAPYPHFDVEGLWQFFRDSIAELNRKQPLDALTVTTHGASAALIDDEGNLTLPVLDYEYPGPDALKRDYDKLRPDFAETFTPRLPGGLNLGAQLYWQSQNYPNEWAKTRWILPYPQYWAYRLTGVPAAEITSLGCHTDLWNFETNLYSSLVLKQGWLEKMPEVLPAANVLGTILPDLAAQLELRPHVPVHVGIHRPNASLLPHLLEQDPPFAVVWTGLWTVVFAPGGELADLDPGRDCLANIDAFGRAVPSARFMGGREYSQLIGDTPPVHVGDAAVSRVLDDAIMLLPSVTVGSGPFPDSKAHWSRPVALVDNEARFVAVSFYLALMTAECLALTGADGNVLIEGPFATNRLFVEMLAAATGRPVDAIHNERTNTSIGAALLANMKPGPQRNTTRDPAKGVAQMAAYAAKWRQATGG